MKFKNIIKNAYLSFTTIKNGVEYKVYRKKDNFNFLKNIKFDFIENGIFKDKNLLYFPVYKNIINDKELYTNINGKFKLNDSILNLYKKLKNIDKFILKSDCNDYCFVEKEKYSIFDYSKIFLKNLKKYDKKKLWLTNNNVVSYPFYLSKGSILKNYKINVESFDYKFLDFNFLGVLDLTNNEIIDKGTRIINDSNKIPIFFQCLFYQYNQKYNILDQYDFTNIPLEKIFLGKNLKSENLLFIIYKNNNTKKITHLYIS